jgi:hypothetical protein
MTRLAALVVALALLAGVLPTRFAAAAANTVIDSATVDNGYPKQLTFKITAHSDSNITDFTLNYSITGRGTSALSKPDAVTPGKTVSAEVVLQVNSGSSYIPVGSDFTYRWEVTTADGSTLVGPETKFFYLPPNQNWQTVKSDFMTVYYHGDKTDIANAYLKAGVDTYERIGKQLFNITLQQIPVKVILFDDEKESNSARQATGGRFDATVTTCGTKVTNDIVLVIPVACGSPDRTDTLRHEFGHILNQTAGEGSLARLPSWLDEGTAVYAQSTPGDYATAFNAAAKANRLIPFAQMDAPATDPNLVGIFYGEAYMMVKYLVDKNGPATYSKLFATIKGGTRFDQALQQVYGFDLAGFEKEFRTAVSAAPAAPAATVAPTRPAQQAQPTRAPATRPAAQVTATAPTRTAPASSSGGDNNIGNGTIAIVGIAVVFGLLAVFAFLISTLLANQRASAAAAAHPPAPPSQPDDWRPPDFGDS